MFHFRSVQLHPVPLHATTPDTASAPELEMVAKYQMLVVATSFLPSTKHTYSRATAWRIDTNHTYRRQTLNEALGCKTLPYS